MSDDKTVKYGTGAKSIRFEDIDKAHADLKIRLHYDGLTQGVFFRSLIRGYLEKDKNIIGFIQQLKEELKFYGADRRSKSYNLIKKGSDIANSFALDSKEIENIFDMIAKEHPDL